METQAPYTFANISDVEVYPHHFLVAGKDSVGCKKTHSDVMLTFQHNHSTDAPHRGNVYVFLDEFQLVTLINVLDKALLRHLKSKA